MTQGALSSATFRCGDHVVTVRYLGKHSWEFSGPRSSWSGPHEKVTIAIRDALDLSSEVPYNTKAIEVTSDRLVTGTIKNNTFPTNVGSVNRQKLLRQLSCCHEDPDTPPFSSRSSHIPTATRLPPV